MSKMAKNENNLSKITKNCLKLPKMTFKPYSKDPK